MLFNFYIKKYIYNLEKVSETAYVITAAYRKDASFYSYSE